MQRVTDFRATLSAFYDAVNRGDVGRLAQLAEQDQVTVTAIAPASFLAELGVMLEGGPKPAGLEAEKRETGFAHDTPTIVAPDGTKLPSHLTMMLAREDEWSDWKIVHCSFSVGLTDEEAKLLPAV